MKKIILIISCLLAANVALGQDIKLDYFQQRETRLVWKFWHFLESQHQVILERSDLHNGAVWYRVDSFSISYDPSSFKLQQSGLYRLLLDDASGYRSTSDVVKVTFYKDPEIISVHDCFGKLVDPEEMERGKMYIIQYDNSTIRKIVHL